MMYDSHAGFLVQSKPGLTGQSTIRAPSQANFCNIRGLSCYYFVSMY
jgi:hypothetical protein